MTHISRCYLPHVGRGPTSHDAIRSDIMIWLSDCFYMFNLCRRGKSNIHKRSTFHDSLHASLAIRGKLGRVRAWHREKSILLLKLNIFATPPCTASWKPDLLSTLFVRHHESSILLTLSSRHREKVFLMMSLFPTPFSTLTDLQFFVVCHCKPCPKCHFRPFFMF